MQTWNVHPQPGAGSVDLASVDLLLQAPGARQPAAKLLAFVDAIAPVDYLSLVEYVPSRRDGLAAPELVEGHAAPGIENVTPDCFALYRERFWRQDEATRLAQHLGDASAPVTALRFAPADIGLPSWRRDIYDRARLDDRLSFFYSPVRGSAFAINLYRGRRHGAFGEAEIGRLLAVAPLLRQAHRAVLGAARDTRGRDQRIADAAEALRRRAPELSERERAVCARIACGITADGIAVDLDVAPSTVTTLRKRAYAKLAARGLGTGRYVLAAFVQ
ncbi:MAG: helix-turn-helix transcriptional regulator [Ramlibacter sp.]